PSPSSPPKTATPPATAPTTSTTTPAPIASAMRRRRRSASRRSARGNVMADEGSGAGRAPRRGPSTYCSALVDGDGLLRALPDGLIALLPQLVRRVLLEHVEEVVVTDLEHFGDDAHAGGIALAEVEVDHDLPGHCASKTRVGTLAGPTLSASTPRRGRRGGYETCERRRAATT